MARFSWVTVASPLLWTMISVGVSWPLGYACDAVFLSRLPRFAPVDNMLTALGVGDLAVALALQESLANFFSVIPFPTRTIAQRNAGDNPVLSR